MHAEQFKPRENTYNDVFQIEQTSVDRNRRYELTAVQPRKRNHVLYVVVLLYWYCFRSFNFSSDSCYSFYNSWILPWIAEWNWLYSNPGHSTQLPRLKLSCFLSAGSKLQCFISKWNVLDIHNWWRCLASIPGRVFAFITVRRTTRPGTSCLRMRQIFIVFVVGKNI